MAHLEREYALLGWHVEAGADEAVGEAPVNHYQTRPAASLAIPGFGETARSGPKHQSRAATMRQSSSAPAPPVAMQGEEASKSARSAAQSARDLTQLRHALDNFNGCELKKTAMNLVFADGNPKASVMMVGEAPGADEDRQGLPFVGMSGQLLDHMISHIGLNRTNTYISNILPWRPPGNRTPQPEEVAICLPFIERHIELVSPDILILVGGVAAKTLLGVSESIGKLRGRWFSYQTPNLARPIKARATFHPAYLLRSPGQKSKAWQDLLSIEDALKTSS